MKKLILIFLFFCINSKAQNICVSSLVPKDLDNYNFLDGKFYTRDSIKYEPLFYDRLISFKVFYNSSNTIWYEFSRIDDSSFLEMKYFKTGKLAESIRYITSDSILKCDTVPNYDLWGNYTYDTVVCDTIINLVEDGRAYFHDTSDFVLRKTYSKGNEVAPEVYFNSQYRYTQWNIGYQLPNDTTYENKLIDPKLKNQKEELLMSKEWATKNYDEFQTINSVAKFDFEPRSLTLILNFKKDSLKNYITITGAGIDSKWEVKGTWKVDANNYLTFATPTDERTYLLLYLGDWVDGDVLYMKLISLKKL